jgi:Pectate lyase superfamily protein
MKYPYRQLGVGFDRDFRNGLNENLKDIEYDIRQIGGEAAQKAEDAAHEANTQAVFAQEQGDYANDKGDYAANQGDFAKAQGNHAQTQGDYAKTQGDSAKTNWLSPVNDFSAIATTYSKPTLGDTVQCLDNGYVYRYNGSNWVFTQGYSATAIADVNTKLAQLANEVTWLSIKNYGAKGDGVTDDSQAFISCITAAVSGVLNGQNTGVFIPKGNYIIKQDGVFSNIPYSSIGSMRFLGEGWMNTILTLSPSGSDLFLYNNGYGNSKFQFATFEGIQFTSNNDTYGNGFKIWSGGYEQGFKFIRCWMRGLNQWIQHDGSVGNSEYKYDQCKITFIRNKVFNINNAQSVNHELYGCDIESIYGDVFYINTGGGGSIKMFGGSVIMANDIGDTTDHYFLNNNGSGNTGTGNDDMLFVGVKTELRSAYSKLVKSSLSGGSLWAHFIGSNFMTTVGGTREVVLIDTNKTVIFDKCKIPDNFTYRITGGSQSQSYNGNIRFHNCRIPSNIGSLVTIVSGYGTVVAENCIDINPNPTKANAIDVDVNWQNRVMGDLSIKLKTAVIKPAKLDFPSTGFPERTITIPQNSVIKNIYIQKPAFGASNIDYRLFVGNDNKTTTYGSSTLGPAKNQHVINVENLFLEVGTDLNLRTIRLWAETTYSGSPGALGYAIVEYY